MKKKLIVTAILVFVLLVLKNMFGANTEEVTDTVEEKE